MTIYRSDACRNALMTALNTQRGTSAKIEIRTGAPSGTASQGTLLVTLTGNAGGWGTPTAGVLTSSAISAGTAVATGTAGHYELKTSGDTWLESGLVDGTDGVSIDNTSIASGQTVQMSTGSPNWVNTAAYDDGV